MTSEHEPWERRIAPHIDEIHGEVTGACTIDRRCPVATGCDVSVVRTEVFALV
jgi:hypothetical protein